jgi:radical SAM superfamily enzyme YgiQ (UPF0313 family)
MKDDSVENKILLTADRTLMSDYRRNEFLGFGACAPPNFIPDWLFEWLFFPPIKAEDGEPIAAPYGLRKVEAQLIEEGLDVLTVAPDHLSNYIDKARVLGIHVMDPFGLGPASSTFASILKKEPFLAQHFRALLSSDEVRKAKKRGLRIIVGGPGSWQFRYREKFVAEFGIDCVIEGEAEKVVGEIFGAALKGESLPKRYEVGIKEVPKLDEIPDIVNPSVNGLVELGRGCCRGCDFCSVTLRPLRWHPYEKIMREVDVNVEGGIKWGCLHAEDVMLYGSTNTMPNDEKLVKLHKMVVEKCKGICWSHCSLAPIAAKPKLFAEIAQIIRQKQPWWGVEVGIETGSAELAKKIMPAKAHPFKAEEWPQVVRTAMGLMHDNKLIPACTLIVGSPEETDADVIKTVELIDDLKDVRSLIVPLFFVPMGKLKDEDWFRETQMTELHKELLIKCAEHDFFWVGKLIDLAVAGRWYSPFLKSFYGLFAALGKYKVKKAGIPIENR